MKNGKTAFKKGYPGRVHSHVINFKKKFRYPRRHPCLRGDDGNGDRIMEKKLKVNDIEVHSVHNLGIRRCTKCTGYRDTDHFEY